MDIIHDRWGNEIYLTDERWEHIYERHPEIIGYEEYVLKTLRFGNRKQQPLDPDIFRYFAYYNDLPEHHTQVVVIVKFGQKTDEQEQIRTNNFVVTSYMK